MSINSDQIVAYFININIVVYDIDEIVYDIQTGIRFPIIIRIIKSKWGDLCFTPSTTLKLV